MGYVWSAYVDVSSGLVYQPMKRVENDPLNHDGLKEHRRDRRNPFPVKGNDGVSLDFYEVDWKHPPNHAKAHSNAKPKKQHKEEDSFLDRLLEAQAMQLEKREYEDYELGDLFDSLQRWKAKKDEGFVHETLTAIAEHVSLPMELFGRKVIGGVVRFFSLIGQIFQQSRGIIFLLSGSYVILILGYFIFSKCCFGSRRNQKSNPQGIRETVTITKRSGMEYLSYPSGRASDGKLYPKMPSDSVPFIEKKTKGARKETGENMV